MINNKPKWKFPLLSISLLCLYLFSRLQNILAIPIFGDEAIYVRWSQIIKSVESLRFLPLTDGKQPLFMWLTAANLKFFSDPLLASRLISVAFGFITLISIFFSTLFILNFSSSKKEPLSFIKDSFQKYKYSALLSSFLYLSSAYTFFFDRIALPDNQLSSLISLSFSLFLLLLKFPRLDLSLLLAANLGVAWLTKSPALYFVLISSTILLFKALKNKLYLFFTLINLSISFIIYNILRLGPQFQQIALRNKDYIHPLSEIVKHPLDPLKPHLWDTRVLYSFFIHPFVYLFLITSLLAYLYLNSKKASSKDKSKLPSNFFAYLNNNLAILSLLAWLIAPLLATATFVKVFTARYILFTLPPLLILLSLSCTYLLSILKTNYQKFFIAIIFLLQLPSLILITRLSLDPFTVKLPSTEVGYLQDWTSGWGIKDATNYLVSRSKEANVILGTEGYFGTLPDAAQAYANQVPQLTIFGVGLDFTTIPEKLIDAHNHGDEVYLLINKSRNKLIPSELDKLKIIKEYSKPGDDQLVLYLLI